MTVNEGLKKYFGYDAFRGGQNELVSAILSRRDTLGIMPTGAGKSICFQLPAMLLSGITLVVSPLISLMKDQVDALRQADIPAAFINSSLTPRQIELALANAANGKYKIIYIAPERLLLPEFLSFAAHADISLLAVDEAHCISQWGQDFRPSYAQIPVFINTLPIRPIVTAFTATATAHVREDIIRLLALETPFVLVTGFDRTNLFFDVQSPRDKLDALLRFLADRRDRSGIIYCGTRKTVEEVCDALNAQGFSASRYHAGLSDEERKQNQDDFLFDRVRMISATNAFGMGIDKSNVGFVVHYNMPKDIESYYQEAGRAGRDGAEADCLLLYSGQDVILNKWMIENSRDVTYPDPETEALLKLRAYKRLREMTLYATISECYRAFILRYFGDDAPEGCDNCGNCLTEFESVDITRDTQIILSCVARMKGRYGASLVVSVLQGGKNARVRAFGLDKLSTYGLLPKSVYALRTMIDALVQNGYLEQSEGQYPVLQLGPRAQDVLTQDEPVFMKIAKDGLQEASERPSRKSRRKAGVPPEREELYCRLQELRKMLAAEQSVPAFVVFSDRSLVDMCFVLPQTDARFLDVSGVGEAKRERYGAQFLGIIRAFCEETGITEAVVQDVEPRVRKKRSRDHAEGEKRVRKRLERTEEEKLERRRGREQNRLDSLVLPGQEAMEAIPISVQPIQLSWLAANINDTIEERNCTRISAARIASWLMARGYLQIAEEDAQKNKIPTAYGAEMGITQEMRDGAAGAFSVNLYSETMQRTIVAHMHDIQRSAHEE